MIETDWIYKILRADEWAALQRDGDTSGAPVDIADGFIHFSTQEQVAETAARHFVGQSDLWLLAVAVPAVDDRLRWERSRGGALFPHLHASLRLDEVAWARPLPLINGVHRFSFTPPS